MTEHPTGRHSARPSTQDTTGHPIPPGRAIGFVELYGRLLASADTSADTSADGPAERMPVRPADPPTSLHQRVVADLTGVPASDGMVAGDGAYPPSGGPSLVYQAVGIVLTAKAALLADLVPLLAPHPGAYTAAARRAAHGLAGMPTARADRQVGDIAVLASLHDLVTVHGPHTTTPRSGPGPTPPVFTPDGRPASMFGHILPTWGLTAQDAPRLPAPDWAANLLTAAGWTMSARAWSAIVAAQNAEATGASWAAATRRADAAAGRIRDRAPWDRRRPGRHRTGQDYAQRRRPPPGGRLPPSVRAGT